MPTSSQADFLFDAPGISADFRRQRLDSSILSCLRQLAEDCDWQQGRGSLFEGEEINRTEGRAVLHTALRADHPIELVREEVAECRDRMEEFCSEVVDGLRTNVDGESFTDVINIGIGGSDLGPRMVYEALRSEAHEQALRAHFVGNLDPHGLSQVLTELDPKRCLVVITSKSFTTQETLQVALRVREWLSLGGGNVASQCLAVTSAVEKAVAFGVASECIFPLWSWVGGRFSLWSAVGLSLGLSLGWRLFDDLRRGAAAMDEHFLQAPVEKNLPLNWALINLWNRNFLEYSSWVNVAYSDRLSYLTPWLQQLEMESNGKRVGRDGEVLPHPTAAVVWGGVGTHCQHAYFQSLHQGAAQPVDFVLIRNDEHNDPELHKQLIANALAQSAALAHGRKIAGQPERDCPGNCPSSLIWLEDASARSLGALLSAHEHRCFVQGWLWGLNSFDQFGVELGKSLASEILQGMQGDSSAYPDELSRNQAEFYLKP